MSPHLYIYYKSTQSRHKYTFDFARANIDVDCLRKSNRIAIIDRFLIVTRSEIKFSSSSSTLK